MIRADDFKPVTLADRDLFRGYYLRFPQTHTEYLFTTLVSWVDYTPAYYLEVGDSLLLMVMNGGIPCYRLPIGARDEALLEDLIDLAKKSNSDAPIAAIDESGRQWLESIYPGVKLTADRDFFDYVYLSSDLADLPGKRYLTQRNNLNKFRRRYEYTVEDVSPENIGGTKDFLVRWCRQHGCDSIPLLDAEVKASIFCTEHFFDLGLSGITIKVGGNVQALSVYEPMGRSTATVHIEKAMQGYDGIYQAVNNEAALRLRREFKYINRQSDLGVPGLRTAKERLHPDHMEKLYYLTRESIETLR